MTVSNARPVNPVQEDFAGRSVGRTAKRFFHATRPKFFPASVLPVLAGTAWGMNAAGQIDAYSFFLAVVATVCVHAASNVLNDVGDESNGSDRRNNDRIYPYTGGSRFIQTGILDKSAMTRLGMGLLLAGLVAGALLLVHKGPVIALFGIAGILLGVFYSLGPVRFSSIGLGETVVALAFGVLPVTGAAWLQGAAIDAPLLMFSVPISAWVAAILLINEVPDIDADGSCGKRTLPVRLGLRGTSRLYAAIQISAPAVIVALSLSGDLPAWSPVLPFVLLLMVLRATAAIRKGLDDRAGLTKAIESTLAIHMLGSLWLAACMLISLWWPGI